MTKSLASPPCNATCPLDHPPAPRTSCWMSWNRAQCPADRKPGSATAYTVSGTPRTPMTPGNQPTGGHPRDGGNRFTMDPALTRYLREFPLATDNSETVLQQPRDGRARPLLHTEAEQDRGEVALPMTHRDNNSNRLGSTSCLLQRGHGLDNVCPRAVLVAPQPTPSTRDASMSARCRHPTTVCHAQPHHQSPALQRPPGPRGYLNHPPRKHPLRCSLQRATPPPGFREPSSSGPLLRNNSPKLRGIGPTPSCPGD